MQGRGFLLMGAATLGMAIAWVDSRPNWDDTGITAGTLFLMCDSGRCQPQAALAMGAGSRIMDSADGASLDA